ncbi:MAG: caspase-domain protein [Proteobacteria bacterium]|nr:caspase-domain protein [Pseudomonadota bacterium]MBS1229273.1 caspase-domain protein [Pseudomonadota bacterium]
MNKLLVLSLLLAARLVCAQTPMAERQAVRAAVAVDSERKIALVIGNGAYRSQPLPNPPLDAKAMSAALQKLGFETTSLVDADRLTMVRGLENFRGKLKGANVALVYFAGHGIQMEGQNYLIPVDADMEHEDSVKYNTVSQQNVLDELERGGTPIKIVILDACRNNPFERGRGNSGGLAAASNAAQGTLIAYATSPGRVALDGRAGENGLYTTHLLRALQTPGLGIEEVFKATRVSVAEASRGRQIPWETTSLTGNLTLLPGTPSTQHEASVATASLAVAGAARSAGRSATVGSVFRDCPRCPEMSIVPAGRFVIGSPVSESERQAGEGPQKSVTIARPLAVGRFEVTFEEWEACLLDGGCDRWPNDRGWGRGRRPVIDVSWEDAQRYVGWLSRKTQRSYRLLSEAEWEYAARAGTTSARPWGDALGARQAVCRDCATPGKGTQEAGTTPANAWQLHDMLGNVWEWTADCQNSGPASIPDNGSANALGDCSRRAIRGGSWDSAAKAVRSATRAFYPLSRREDNIGFRVAAEVD